MQVCLCEGVTVGLCGAEWRKSTRAWDLACEIATQRQRRVFSFILIGRDHRRLKQVSGMSTERSPLSKDGLTDQSPHKRVAVVGSGVAGLAASWALNEYSSHEVVLFESNDYIGGHTHTVEFTKDGKTTPVDSGFIVSSKQFCVVDPDEIRLPTPPHIQIFWRS